MANIRPWWWWWWWWLFHPITQCYAMREPARVVGRPVRPCRVGIFTGPRSWAHSPAADGIDAAVLAQNEMLSRQRAARSCFSAGMRKSDANTLMRSYLVLVFRAVSGCMGAVACAGGLRVLRATRSHRTDPYCCAYVEHVHATWTPVAAR